MANASAKKTAAANETALRTLRNGTLVAYALAVVLRILLRRTSTYGLVLAASTAAPSVAIYQLLTRIGTPKRDARGELISSGDDLNASGLTEYAWDVVFVTWGCQVGSALLGEWVWYLYLAVRPVIRFPRKLALRLHVQIPVFAVYKLWGFVGPMLGLAGLGGGGAPPIAGEDEAAAAAAQPSSKRQEKLKKRAERGDPRIKQVQRNA